MFKFIAKRKFNKAMRDIRSLECIHPENWEEFKGLHIKAMILGCMVNLGSNNDPGWAVMQAQEIIGDSQRHYANCGITPGLYAELLIAIGAEVLQLPQHYRETAAKIEEIRKGI